MTHELFGITTGAGGGSAELLSIDPETGAGVVVGAHGVDTSDLAFAPSGLLYTWGEDGDGDDLHRIDTATGVATPVGDCGFVTTPPGVAVDATGAAVMKDGTDLFSVDRVTGACALGATVSGATDEALAFDRWGTLYTLDRTGAGAELFTLDPATGALTSLGTNGLSALSALAFRPLQHHAMFAADLQAGSTLYRLDPRDGSLIQTLGSIGFDHVTGLAFQPGTSSLFGATTSGGSSLLLSIDPLTGAGTSIGSHGLAAQDIAFSPDGGLYAWAEGPDDLHTLDPGTGAAASVGECGFGTIRTGLTVDSTFGGWMKAGDDLYSVDLDTGACSLETALSDEADNVLAITDAGTFYTAGRFPTTVYTLDRQTGDLLTVGGNAISTLSSIAFLPEPGGDFGLLAAGVLLTMLSRRRRA